MLELNKLPKRADDSKLKRASEKVIIKGILKDKFPVDEQVVMDVIKNVSSQTGLDPAFLAANAMQEGMNDVIINKRKGKFMDYTEFEDYPVSGYAYYGLDTFGSKYPELVKKGYLPTDFNKNFVPNQKKNEKQQDIMSAEFKTNKDALLAKSAMIRDIADNVDEYAKKNGINLEPKAKNYFIMSAYNGGFGNAKIMMDEMKGSNVSQSEFISKGLTSRKGVHKNIAPRMDKIDMINEILLGDGESGQPKIPMYKKMADIMEMVNKAYGKK